MLEINEPKKKKGKVGRPKKPQSELAKYQRIAVHKRDYDKLQRKLKKYDIDLVTAFAAMVEGYRGRRHTGRYASELEKQRKSKYYTGYEP